MSKYFTYKHEMPSLTVDVVLVDEHDRVLLIKRGGDFEKGKWALPGGFVNKLEPAVKAAQRELKEETGVEIPLDRFAFITVADKPERDPRGWVVSLVFGAYIQNLDDLNIKAADDADDHRIVSVHDFYQLDLAFDHKAILADMVGANPYQEYPIGIE